MAEDISWLDDRTGLVDPYSQHEKPSPALALSKSVFGEPIGQQVAAVELSEVTVCSSAPSAVLYLKL